MWTIDKPALTALEAFETCIGGVRKATLKKRMSNIREQIVAGEAAFDAAAEASTLYLIPTAARVGAVTAKEMGQLYDRHMARGKSHGRPIYDQLMLAAENGTCPFCGHRTVSTLDHSLPKSTHPALAVTPVNLIPCCSDCNHDKSTRRPASTVDQLLNAYYDDVSADRWLFARIVGGTPAAARFFVDAPHAWEDELRARVRNHFKKLHLAKLYAAQAGRMLQNMRGALDEVYRGARAVGVREELERRFRSCAAVMVNSWEGALYQAAAASDWYCDGGFRA